MLSSHFRITAIIWRTRRAPSLSALDGVGSVPRASQRIVQSNIAPLLQPRPNLPTGRRRHGARILLGGVAARHDQPSPREGGGGFRSISVLPFRDARRAQLGRRPWSFLPAERCPDFAIPRNKGVPQNVTKPHRTATRLASSPNPCRQIASLK